MSLRDIAAVFGFACALGACSGDEPSALEPNNITVVNPTRPVGYVAGEIESAATGAPIEGARVGVFGGNVAGEVVTDAAGRFSLGPISAGAGFSVRVEWEGYVPVVLSRRTIDDAAGDFPTDNAALFLGPLSMIPSSGTLDVDVVSPDGAPLPMTEVSLVASPAHIEDGRGRARRTYAAITDANGRASFSQLPDFSSLPADFRGEIELAVASVDLDGDGRADLAGTVAAVDGDDLRAGRQRRLIVLEVIDEGAPLELVATNLRGVVDQRQGPSVVSPMSGVRLVFDRPVDVGAVVVDLSDESGERAVSATAMAGPIEGSVVIEAGALMAGQEYNLDVTVPDAARSSRVRVQRPFFAEESASQAVTVLGRFEDVDGLGSWGTSRDVLRLVTSLPLGRSDARPFQVELWVELDLNGSGMIGDATGELPVAASRYPNPIVVGSAEPTPENGAGRSGFTTRIAPRSLRLGAPLEDANAVVNFEVRFPAARNGGSPVVTPSGRAAPPSFTGSATLVSPPS